MTVGAKQEKSKEVYLEALPNFTVSQKIIGQDGNFGLAIDEGQRKICLIDNRYEIPEYRVFSYKDIISCQLFEDGSMVTKTVRSSQIGGALVGGIALGGVGLMIGGLSGKAESTEKVKRIDLRIIVNDTKNPLHDVNFLYIPTNKESGYYQMSLQKARQWHGIIEVLIRQADTEDVQPTTAVIKKTQSSLTDEIRELAELKNLGILTDDEFKNRKEKLLNS